MNRTLPLLTTTLALLALTGCVINQQDDVNTYRAISDPPGPPATLAPGAPLSLPEALRLTAFGNEQLAARGEQYIQALAARQRASAALRPTFDLFSDFALRENTGTAGIIQSDLGLSGQYRLLTGMSDLRNVSAAIATATARRWLILDLRESLLLQAARAYYESLRAQRLTQVFQSSLTVQEERLRDARARGEAGLARPLDISQTEAQLSRTRAQLITATRQAAEARSTLALLTNANLTTSPLSDGYELPTDSRTLEDFYALAALHRQDITAARADAEAARALVDSAIGQYAPTLTLNLDYFLLRGPQDTAANIASLLQARLPLFSAGRIEADIRSAWSVFRQRVLDYRLRTREANNDVQTAFLQRNASAERAIELTKQVNVARETLTLAEASYAAGLGTNLERITAQDQLLAAELEAVSESFTTKTAHLALLRACGLLSADLINTPLPPLPNPESNTPTLDSPFLTRPNTPTTPTTPTPPNTPPEPSK